MVKGYGSSSKAKNNYFITQGIIINVIINIIRCTVQVFKTSFWIFFSNLSGVNYFQSPESISSSINAPWTFNIIMDKLVYILEHEGQWMVSLFMWWTVTCRLTLVMNFEKWPQTRQDQRVPVESTVFCMKSNTPGIIKKVRIVFSRLHQNDQTK